MPKVHMNVRMKLKHSMELKTFPDLKCVQYCYWNIFHLSFPFPFRPISFQKTKSHQPWMTSMSSLMVFLNNFIYCLGSCVFIWDHVYRSVPWLIQIFSNKWIGTMYCVFEYMSYIYHTHTSDNCSRYISCNINKKFSLTHTQMECRTSFLFDNIYKMIHCFPI